MTERRREGFGRFSRLKGTILFAGAAFAAVLLVYAAGAMSHHHDGGAFQLVQGGCGGHGGPGQAHGGCPIDVGDNAEGRGHEKVCPLLRGEKEDGNCPVKRLIGNRVVCPVMEGRVFTADKNTIAVEHEGRIYLLCCPPCEGRFKADPERYTRHNADNSGSGHHGH